MHLFYENVFMVHAYKKQSIRLAYWQPLFHLFIKTQSRFFLSTSLHLSNRIFCQMLVRCLTCCPPPRVVDEQNYPPLHKVTAFGWWWVLIPHPVSVCPRFMNCRASFSSTCAGKSQADLMRRGQNLPKLKCREWNQNIKHSNEPLRCSELTRMLRKFSLRSAHDTLSLITQAWNLETEGMINHFWPQLALGKVELTQNTARF